MLTFVSHLKLAGLVEIGVGLQRTWCNNELVTSAEKRIVGLGVYALSSAYGIFLRFHGLFPGTVRLPTVLLVRSRLTAKRHIISRHFPEPPA